MYWSFRYEGPPRFVDDPDCHGCLAVASKKCRKGEAAHAYAVPVHGAPHFLKLSEFRGMFGKEPFDRLPETVFDPRDEGEPEEKRRVLKLPELVRGTQFAWVRENFRIVLTEPERDEWLKLAAAQVRDHCPTCVIERRIAAGHKGVCPNHCGLVAAIDEYETWNLHGRFIGLSERANEPSWDAFLGAASALLDSLPEDVSVVEVQAQSMRDHSEGPAHAPSAALAFAMQFQARR